MVKTIIRYYLEKEFVDVKTKKENPRACGRFRSVLEHGKICCKSRTISRYGHQHIFSPKEYSKLARKEMAKSLKTARIELINAGFKADKVSTQIVTKAISRAGAIADIPNRENFGTIVMGRRGHSSVRDFFIGRVTNKVIQTARDRTVWVIR